MYGAQRVLRRTPYALLVTILASAFALPFGEAILAIDRAVFAWLERNLAFLFAFTAGRFVHFARSPVKSTLISHDASLFWDPAKEPIKEIMEIDENYKEFRISDYNLMYVRKILTMLLASDIKVIVCLTPVRDDEMRIWNKYNLRTTLNNKIQEEISRYNNIIAFWDMQSVASDPKYFVDRYHVSCSGAMLYTAEMSKRIQALELFVSDSTE